MLVGVTDTLNPPPFALSGGRARSAPGVEGQRAEVGPCSRSSYTSLKCADGSYYVGHTDDLEARVGAHEMGLISGYTRRRRPVTFQYAAEFGTREEALASERQIKGWSRA